MIKFKIVKGSYKFMNEEIEGLRYEDFYNIILENDNAMRNGQAAPHSDLDILVIKSDDYYLITKEANYRLYSLIEQVCSNEATVVIQNPHKDLETRIMKNNEFDVVTEKFEVEDPQKVLTELSHIYQKENLRSIYSKILFSRRMDSNVPVVFLLYGNTGLGKTFMVKEFSKVFYGEEKELLRVQLSNYQNYENLTNLFGEEINSNDLVTKLQNRESDIILLDEFDKVHSLAYNSFYTIFDEGVAETRFKRADISNLIIFCTSNFTSVSEIEKNIPLPIFNRIDKFIKFENYTKEQVDDIIKLEVERIGLVLGISDNFEVIENIVKKRLNISLSKINYRLVLKTIEDTYEKIIFDRLMEPSE